MELHKVDRYEQCGSQFDVDKCCWVELNQFGGSSEADLSSVEGSDVAADEPLNHYYTEIYGFVGRVDEVGAVVVGNGLDNDGRCIAIVEVCIPRFDSHIDV